MTSRVLFGHAVMLLPTALGVPTPFLVLTALLVAVVVLAPQGGVGGALPMDLLQSRFIVLQSKNFGKECAEGVFAILDAQGHGYSPLQMVIP